MKKDYSNVLLTLTSVIMNRVCIYPKDVQWLTGKSESQSRYIIRQIKKQYQKERYQAVTIEEFCSYMGLRVEKVRELIR